MVDLKADNVSVTVDGIELVSNASLTIRPGELVVILGANGAGKTTLLRALLGLEKISSGSVTLDGTDVSRLAPVERAKHVAYLPQRRPIAWPNIVRDVVALGRFAHGVALGNLGAKDAAAVAAALSSCDLLHLAERRIDNLSGGELARVHFARALAAHSPFLIADEPVAELDPRHQFNVADLISSYVCDGGGALVVLHEISLAARIADRLVWMTDGRIVADGSPLETLTEKRLEEVYGVRARVHSNQNDLDVRFDGAL